MRILARMKIYTRTGDSGETGLVGGARVLKSDPRVAAYGDIDELNASIGVAWAHQDLAGDIRDVLTRIQRDLFAVGSQLADPDARRADRTGKTVIAEADVTRLEQWIDRFDAELAPLRRFILPGGGAAGAALHFSRTVCRRAERAMVGLGADALDRTLIVYINRLSDLLFVLARVANHRGGHAEVEW